MGARSPLAPQFGTALRPFSDEFYLPPCAALPESYAEMVDRCMESFASPRLTAIGHAQALGSQRFLALVLLHVVLTEQRARALPASYSLQNPPLPEIIFYPGPLRVLVGF